MVKLQDYFLSGNSFLLIHEDTGKILNELKPDGSVVLFKIRRGTSIESVGEMIGKTLKVKVYKEYATDCTYHTLTLKQLDSYKLIDHYINIKNLDSELFNKVKGR